MTTIIATDFGADEEPVDPFASSGGAQVVLFANTDFRARVIRGPASIRSISASVRQVSAIGAAIAETAAFTGGKFGLLVIRGGQAVDKNFQLGFRDQARQLGQIIFNKLCPANNNAGFFNFAEGELECQANEFLNVIMTAVMLNTAAMENTLTSLAVRGYPTGKADLRDIKLR